MDKLSIQALHEFIEDARDQAGAQAHADARRYVVGQHDEVTTQDQRAMLGARATRPPMANVTGQAVREISGRLQFRRFLLEGDSETSGVEAADNVQALAAFFEQLAVKNRLGKRIVAWAGQAMTDGTTAAMVSWNTERAFPVIHDEPWWDGETGMFAHVDAAGETEWAVKEWHDGQRERRTIYTPGLIRRFHRESGGWQQIDESTITKGENGPPVGVPVAVLTNTLNQYTPYGLSDVTAVMGLQDELNGVLFDLNSASMFTGMQILTGTGVDTKEDVDVSPGTMLRSSKPDAKFSAIPAGNIEQLLAHKHELIADIAAQFPVPSYRIGAGDFPAGIALQRADGPMIAKVHTLGDLFAPGIVLLAHRATELANIYGGQSLDEDVLIGVEWAPPDQVDPGTQVEIDRERADLYAAIERLTPTMIRKTRVLTKDEVEKLLEEREVNRLQVERAINAGRVSPAFEDDEEETA